VKGQEKIISNVKALRQTAMSDNNKLYQEFKFALDGNRSLNQTMQSINYNRSFMLPSSRDFIDINTTPLVFESAKSQKATPKGCRDFTGYNLTEEQLLTD